MTRAPCLSTRDCVVVVDLVLHGMAHSTAVQRPTDVEERCKLYTRMAMYKDAAELAIQLQDGDLLAMIRQSYAVPPNECRPHCSKCAYRTSIDALLAKTSARPARCVVGSCSASSVEHCDSLLSGVSMMRSKLHS